MKKLICIGLWSVSLLGCGLNQIPQKMDQTNERIEQLIQNMNHIEGAIDKQSKLIPFENMLKSEHAENLSPFPTRLIPFGKELAEVLNAEEMVELAFLWLKEIDEVFPARRLDSRGEEIPYSKEEIQKINHEKTSRLMGLQIIAGFLPQAIVDQIINQQIYDGGRYEDTAYAVLMLRIQFIRDVLLEAGLFSAPLNSAAKLAQAVEYNKSIDILAKLPSAHKIFLKIKGFIPAEISPSEKFNPAMALKNWRHLQTLADSECKVHLEGVTGNSAQDQALYKKKLQSYNRSKALIQTYIDSWTVKQPTRAALNPLRTLH